jgi:hypothetical protein
VRTDTTAVELLLLATTSAVPDGVAVVAVFEIVPVAAAPTIAVTAKVAVAPLLRLIDATMFPDPLAGQELPAATGATEQVQVIVFNVLGKVSVTLAAVTDAGPLLVTEIA